MSNLKECPRSIFDRANTPSLSLKAGNCLLLFGHFVLHQSLEGRSCSDQPKRTQRFEYRLKIGKLTFPPKMFSSGFRSKNNTTSLKSSASPYGFGVLRLNIVTNVVMCQLIDGYLPARRNSLWYIADRF